MTIQEIANSIIRAGEILLNIAKDTKAGGEEAALKQLIESFGRNDTEAYISELVKSTKTYLETGQIKPILPYISSLEILQAAKVTK